MFVFYRAKFPIKSFNNCPGTSFINIVMSKDIFYCFDHSGKFLSVIITYTYASGAVNTAEKNDEIFL